MDTEKKINVTIFGSSGKIGLSLAKKFLEKDHNLNLFYRKKEKKNILKKKLNYKLYKKKISFLKYSSSSENILVKHIKKNRDIFKKTDLLIITVGEQGEIVNFFNSSMKKFKRTFFVNFMFYVILFKNLFSIIKKKKMLVILFSGGGSTSYRHNFSSYSLTKLCLVKFTEILSHEMQNRRIRFNILAPGIIYSNMTKKILKKKNIFLKKELSKIKNNIKYTEKNINKIFETINFLNSEKGKLISGKLISSAWDNISKLESKKINKLIKTDIYTLRRREF